MNQFPRCDWLPERARWSYTARSGFLACSRKNKDHFFGVLFHLINPFTDQACSVKMAGYWPRYFFYFFYFILFFFFLVFIRTSTSSLSINTQKKLGQYPAIQEPMTRSLQLYCVRVTAFSQTDLFLD